MTRFILSLLLLLTLVSISHADDGNDGFVQSTNGHWYTAANPGVPHTRTKKTWGEWLYSRNGCYCQPYYQNYYYYTFTPVSNYDVPNVDSPNFDSELLRALTKQQTRNANLLALQQSGLMPTQWPYPANGVGGSNPFFGTYGAQGSTLMGHNYVQQNADFYGTGLNADLAFQQSMQFGQLSSASFDKAQGYNAQNLKLALDNDAKRMEMQERRLTALGLMAQVKPEPRASLSSTAVTPQGVVANVAQNVGGRITPAFVAAAKSCLQCHGDGIAKPAGGYRVSQHWQLSRDQRKRVFEELLLTGDMPRSLADHTKPSGHPLPIAQAVEFLDPDDRTEALRVAGSGQ